MKKILAALVTLVVGYVYKGWVLSVLWGWFIVRQFNAPAIVGIAQAIGLVVMVSMLTQYNTDTRSKTELESWAIGITGMFIQPTMALIIGFVASLFL